MYRSPVAPVADALRQMALCASPERTIAAVDSAIRNNQLTLAEWVAVIAPMPRRLRRLLQRVDPRAASITESVVRFRLEMLGIETRRQVAIRGVGYVDMVIGTALVIEVDGKRYHTDAGRFEKDRRRDAALTAAGYRVIRITWRRLRDEPYSVTAQLGALLAATPA